MSRVAQVKFTDYKQSVADALDLIGAGQELPQEGLIILKPNLTCRDKPPVTTPVEIVEAVYLYCRTHCPVAEIIIGEGCGKGDTDEIFDSLGYTALSRKYNIRLIDFNKSKAVLLKNPKAFQLKEFFIPEIALNA